MRWGRGWFLAPKTLRDRFGGVNAIKNLLGIDETPPALEKSFKVATKLSRELPTDIEKHNKILILICEHF